MKVRKKYQCEVCTRLYDTPAEAEHCEADGIPVRMPRGLIFGNPAASEDTWFAITFVVAEHTVTGHRGDVSCWAFRDNGHGDNGPPGRNYCGSPGAFRLQDVSPATDADRAHPSWRRAVAALVANGIQPSYVGADRRVKREPTTGYKQRAREKKKAKRSSATHGDSK